jgi:hypothetical protein
MEKKMEKSFLLVAMLFFSISSYAASVMVTFSGVTGSNPGPYTSPANYSGSFIINGSDVATATVDDLQITVEGDSYSATGGSLNQFAGKYFNVGGFSGFTSTGSPFTFEGFSVDWRAPVGGVFSSTTVVANNLTEADLNYRRVVIDFVEGSHGGAIIDHADTVSFSTLNVSAVPVPAALFMFAPALLGFMGLRRKTGKTVA